MFTAEQREKYARVLIWGMGKARRKPFRRGDLVIVRYDMASTPLAEVVYRALIEMGMNVVHRVSLTPSMERSFYGLSGPSQLSFRVPGEAELNESLNGSITIRAPERMTHLRDVGPERIAKAAKARKYLGDILDSREARGDFGWTLGIYPTAELATHARISIEEYARQVTNACRLDEDDPVSWWEDVYCTMGELKHWLNSLKMRRLVVEAENTDLVVTPGRSRRWVGISGHNIPSFELFISPDWRGTSGVFHADQPSYRSGNYVRGVRLEFREGRVVKASAEEGEEFLLSQISMDRGASRIGEFSLTDKRFSRITTFMANTLYDENYGGDHGNCHIALGDSYTDSYDGDASGLSTQRKRALGFNDSALHWDLVNTQRKRVTAELERGGRRVIYEDGMFLY